MENKNKPPPFSARDSVSPPPQRVAVPNREEHISLSPSLGSPEHSPPHSYSSSLHSGHTIGEHISLSTANSPARSSLASDHISWNHHRGSWLENEKLHSPENKPPPPPPVVSRDVSKEPTENMIVLVEPMALVERAVFVEGPKAKEAVEGGGGGGDGIGRRRYRPSLSILSGAQREKMAKKAALGFRVFGFLFCLVSFSVMAADRNQGWALDSFDRYGEFRYCMSVNVVGFVYSAAQAFDLSYNLVAGKYYVHHQQQLRYYFDFAVDQRFICFGHGPRIGDGIKLKEGIPQIIAYLLISSSSSAAIRIDDWKSNWGKDKFPDMATASISMSFLAFVALAISSLVSGYALCTSRSM
ncbi:hypothetical protein OROHE_017594 [Orobanche hederae]